MTPSNAGATRSQRVSEILRGRPVGYSLGIGAAAAVLVGAALRSPLLVLAAPVAVAAVVLVLAFRTARARAAEDFYAAFAAGHGLTWYRDWETAPLTPLLGAGDRRRWEQFMTGPLQRGTVDIACGLGLYTYECRAEDDHSSGQWRTCRFTACTADLEEGIALYPGLFLQRRRDLVGRIADDEWLSRAGRHTVELESIAFSRRYELVVDDRQNQLQLRELFTPSLIVFLAGHPLAPCFEYRAGTLVVYVRGRLASAASLGMLLDVTARIATRLRDEVEERPRAAMRTS